MKSNLNRGLRNLLSFRYLNQWAVLRKRMLFQSTLNAFMKLVTINDVYVKAFGKLKMA